MKSIRRVYPQSLALTPAILFVIASNIGGAESFAFLASIHPAATLALYAHAPFLYLGALLGVFTGYLLLGGNSPRLAATFVLHFLFALVSVAVGVLGGLFIEITNLFVSDTSFNSTLGIAMLGLQYVFVTTLWSAAGAFISIVAPYYIWRGGSGLTMNVRASLYKTRAEPKNDG